MPKGYENDDCEFHYLNEYHNHGFVKQLFNKTSIMIFSALNVNTNSLKHRKMMNGHQISGIYINTFSTIYKCTQLLVQIKAPHIKLVRIS